MAFHQYNTFKYNTSQYNTDGFSWLLACVETVASADARVDKPSKPFSETITSSEIFAKYVQSAIRFEFVFLSDSVTKSILNKGMSEVVRTNDWLSIVRTGSQWGN